MLKLRELREKRGLTQLELANLLGVHKMTISKYERESVYPNYEKLINIAIILDTTPNELLGFKKKYKDMEEYLLSLKEE